MNNIFEGAYFGKAYKTRDGSKAILVSLSDFAELIMELDNPPYITSINITCGLDGKIINNYLSSNQDIVSEWQEEINEEELAKQYAENSLFGSKTKKQIAYCAYLKGYRKALMK